MKYLRAAMIINEINLEGLAVKTQIPERTLRSYLSGQAKPPIDKLCKIADVLGVTTDYLLGRE